MSKQTEKAPVAEPTMADVMALVADLQAKLAAKDAPAADADFSEQVADAEKAGAKAVQVVPSLQKGAQPALRVDH